MKFLTPNQYQLEVSRLYEEVREKVHQLLPNARLEHIGASAVPGAISKGDLDVFVGVDRKEVEIAIARLEHNGYRVKADTFRSESLCMLEIDAYEYPVALQVVANGSEFEMFLTFRDALRNSKVLLQEYNQMKHLSKGMSENAYRAKKSAFIENVLKSLQG